MVEITLDEELTVLFVGGVAIDLAPMPYAILRRLIQANGHIVHRTPLSVLIFGDKISHIWKPERNLDVKVSVLRKRIREQGGVEDYIISVKGVGWYINNKYLKPSAPLYVRGDI